MDNEQIEKNITFIIEQQAKFFADIEELKALGAQTDARIDRIGKRLDRAVRLGVQAVRQEREKRREMEETLTAKLNSLIDAQIKAEERQARHAENLVAFQSQVGQALTEMAQAITKTNQRIDGTGNGNGQR